MAAMVDDGDVNAGAERIIGCAFAVSRRLRPGFVERVYENALAFEIADAGLRVERRIPVRVHYRERIVGSFLADLLVEQKVLVELKAARAIGKAHLAQ